MASKLRVTTESIDKLVEINTVRKPPKRRCSQCGGPYFRRNLMEQWTGRNEGHRYGWHKDIAKVCTKCMDENESKRVIAIADVRFGKIEKIKKG